MKRILLRRFKSKFVFMLVLMISFCVISPVFADDDEEGSFAPLSPEFLEWQKEHLQQEELNASGITIVRSSASEYQGGYVPLPVDFSHLAANPPKLDADISSHSGSGIVNVKSNVQADALPSAFDLRNVDGKSYVSSIKNQSPYGTCWAHAALGSMESNYMMQGHEELDLSELHLAWYAYRNANKSLAFGNHGSQNFTTVMNLGGNAFYPAALYARLAGPVSESELPYGTNPPSAGTPESYTRVLRLRDAYYLSMKGKLNVNASDEQRNAIKRLVMQNGSVAVNYYNDDTVFKKTDAGGTAYHTVKTAVNHAVQIIGWDDNYSRDNFKTKPASNGAWLIKNSWGENWYSKGNGYVGDNGCFWMSYESYLIEGTSFVVEDVDPNMNVYEYDPLGICSLWGYSGDTIYAANVFRADRDETLTQVGIYTGDNNLEYDIEVYTGMTSMPASDPTDGLSQSYSSGTIAFAGYHTIALDTPVTLTEGEYFSIVVKFTGYGMTPVERVVSGFSDNAVIETGTFFSPNGSTWITGASKKMNACIKAFTTTGAAQGTAPKIFDGYPPDGQVNVPYSSTLRASGTKPITWSLANNSSLPDGLTLSSTGTISGTPTTVHSKTFTVTVTNAYGTDSKNFTMNIFNMPAITTESLDGYAGYAFSKSLKLNPSVIATWKATSKMPAGLKLNTKTGEITGKPTKAGDYSVSFQATTSMGVVEKDVTFVIYEKPVKPAIKTSSLAKGYIDTEYSQELVITGTYPITVYIEGLPNGLSVNENTGFISGTPTTAGTYMIKLTAENLATSLDNKPVTKTLKLVISAQPPAIAIDEGFELSKAMVGEAYSHTFELSAGTAPVTWKIAGLPAGLKFSNGTISGTPTKAGNFKLTLTVSNSGGKATFKLPLTVLQVPEITTKKLANATTDKSYSAKIAAKGTTPIEWNVEGLPDGLTYSANATGTTLTITGKPTEIETCSLTLTATNEAGSSSLPLELKVNGVAPKLTAVLAKGTVDSDYDGSKISATGTKPITFDYSISTSDMKKFGIDDLSDLGLSFAYDADEATAAITGTPTKSVKGLPITISALNAASNGKAVTKVVKLTITGERPAFTEPDDSVVTMRLEQREPVSVNFTVTGTPDITFSMNKTAGFTLTQSGDYSAVLSGTTPSRDGTTTITITAMNPDGKATKKVIIQTMTAPKITTGSLSAGTVNKAYSAKLAATGTKTIKWTLNGDLPSGMKFSNGAFSGKPTEAGTFALNVMAENGMGTDSKDFTLTVRGTNVTAVPEDDPELDSEIELEAYEVGSKPESEPEAELESESEPAITFGIGRDYTSLSAGQSDMLEEEGYVVVKVLPELTVSESGMYDIEVELEETAEVGAKLFWFAFPKDREATSDDEISEFYDETGAEIEAVPESREITVSVWLTEGTTYEPVIAVKSEKQEK